MQEFLSTSDLPSAVFPREAANAALATEIFCAAAKRLAAGATGVSVREISSPLRSSRRVSGARQIGMYLAHTVAGLPLTTVAGYFGRDRTTAAHACRLVEDRRDDRDFDSKLSTLEDLMRAVVGAIR